MARNDDRMLIEERQSALSATPNIRKAVRRLRWFLNSFDQQVDMVKARTGNHFNVDRGKLTESFIAWLRQFEAQQLEGRRDRKEFTYFCAGLMLSELIRRQPVTLASLNTDLDTADPAAHWPEGYVYVAYCLNVAAAVLDQEFDHKTQLHPTVRDIDTWSSFRENVHEAPSLAIPFLDLFMGLQPSWRTPTIFGARERFKDDVLTTRPASAIDQNRS